MSRSSLSYAILVAIVVHAPLATPSLATDRFFPNQTVVSANGRWRLDGKSPANAGPDRQAFASDFTYTSRTRRPGACCGRASARATQECVIMKVVRGGKVGCAGRHPGRTADRSTVESGAPGFTQGRLAAMSDTDSGATRLWRKAT